MNRAYLLVEMLVQCTDTLIGLGCVFYRCLSHHCYCGMCWLASQITCNSLVKIKHSK